ncbi:hypothetical protein [Priestia filamentosa]|uniref:hypothetical protein n=1 Tax=Priestia filamentosa TaxID=1402861 RepID=UPI00037616B5|nr:hypothetical protein [Priestia filamentosa]
MMIGQWSKNEISICVMLIVIYVLPLFLPKRLSKHMTILSFIWGAAAGFLVEFTIGGGVIDFYTVNDSNSYELFDFFYYIMFAPFGYLFMNFYEVFSITKKTFAYYVTAWSFIGLFANWLFNKLDIIHFKNGYMLSYSFAVFLLIQTITGLYYQYLKQKEHSSEV